MFNTNRSPAAPPLPASRGPAGVVIDRFTGAEGWLSNSAAGPAVYEGAVYPTREHAYQAAKTNDLQERARISAAATPLQAHRLGQTVTLRPGWDAHLRHTVMWQVLASAFGDNPAWKPPEQRCWRTAIPTTTGIGPRGAGVLITGRPSAVTTSGRR